MKWTSAVSQAAGLEDAVGECASKMVRELGELAPDLVIAFVSGHHAEQYADVPRLLRRHFAGALVVGCSGGGVIGDGREVEHSPGLALTAASLPGVELVPFHVESDALPDGDAPPDSWTSLIGVPADRAPALLMLADPFSMQGERLLSGLDYAYPASVKVGGLASGANQPGGNALYLGEDVFDSGVVGIAMHGDIEVDTIVAQGCRPIGRPMQVTECHGNLLVEVDGQTPFEALRDVFQGLEDRDRELAQHSLFLGVVMDELNDAPKLGDYLIRNIMGVDERRGAIAVGELLKEGQTVQFHLRDAETSSQDLSAMLGQYSSDRLSQAESGALLFSCLGRGSYLYGRADHDTDMFLGTIGQMPLTGFFCNGEIGQVGDSTYLHGYTSSFGIFRPKS